MDRDLKKDLRTVREEIKKGIKDVIETLGVLTLNEDVKNDLNMLSTSGNSQIVSKYLHDLDEAKSTFNQKIQPIQQEAESGLQNKFNQYIQSPLSKAIAAVGSAIGELGGKFGLSGEQQKKFVDIFGYIKEKVGEIKGQKGTKKSSWEIENATGLTGIAQGVQHYFNFFQGQFGKAVQGWLDGIWGKEEENGKKTLDWLQAWITTKGGQLQNSRRILGGESEMNIFREDVIKQIREQFSSDEEAAGREVKNGIQNSVTAKDYSRHGWVQAFCKRP
ncbi:Extracellular matrix-binding ebh, putative [Babesia ovata]|uniref:Extracellular matrix-binding ebh, putative n=1 Tax=Babesia ovata TaxID=189622 RepID=A0A2H6KAS3_9APIC|nr:Extracellular matrix-binding ebh, putative [Babesia ovata]GBE60092.1 Extracellular matrix-binding ebh, putative [Babesia ovata]